MGRLQGLSGLTTSVCSQSRSLSTPHGILRRGEPLDVVAREANVSVAKLTEWRERALAGAASALKERERDDREDEIARLKSKVGEIGGFRREVQPRRQHWFLNEKSGFPLRTPAF